MGANDKKVDPVEVFQVLGASDDVASEHLEDTAKQVGASPEVVEFYEKLPPDAEPSDVVAAAVDPESNNAGVEMELPRAEPAGELTIGDVTGENDQ